MHNKLNLQFDIYIIRKEDDSLHLWSQSLQLNTLSLSSSESVSFINFLLDQSVRQHSGVIQVGLYLPILWQIESGFKLHSLGQSSSSNNCTNNSAELQKKLMTTLIFPNSLCPCDYSKALVNNLATCVQIRIYKGIVCHTQVFSNVKEMSVQIMTSGKKCNRSFIFLSLLHHCILIFCHFFES